MNPTRFLHRRTTMVVVTVGVAVGALLGASLAWALFSASPTAEANSFTADILPQGNTPNTSVSPPNSHTVTITFTQAVTTTGGVAIPAADYILTRYPAAGGAGVVVSNSCSGTTTITCTDTPPDGSWQYTDTPTYDINWVGIESAKSGSGTGVVRTTGPTVPAPIVGASHSYVNGITYVSNGVGFTDNATEPGGAVASVSYYWCPVAVGSCTSATGTQIGSAMTSSPYPVTWTSEPADGAYKVVAVGLDTVGNITTSSPTLVTVDNTAPSVSPPSVNGIS